MEALQTEILSRGVDILHNSAVFSQCRHDKSLFAHFIDKSDSLPSRQPPHCPSTRSFVFRPQPCSRRRLQGFTE